MNRRHNLSMRLALPKKQTDNTALMQHYGNYTGMDPDVLFFSQQLESYLTFIVADFNQDGKYEAYYTQNTHLELMNRLRSDGQIDTPKTKKVLPVITGRIGRLPLDPEFLTDSMSSYHRYDGEAPYGTVLTFWGGRHGLWQMLKNYHIHYPEKAFMTVLTPAQLRRLIIPVLMADGKVDQNTYWWDSDFKFQGKVGAGRKPRTKKTPTQYYQFDGRNVTLPELISILHSGTAPERQKVTDFICGSTEPSLAPYRARVECDSPKRVLRQPRINPIRPDGLEFRSQNSLNRAWDTMRQGSRARMLRAVLGMPYPHIELSPGQFRFVDGQNAQHNIGFSRTRPSQITIVPDVPNPQPRVLMTHLGLVKDYLRRSPIRFNPQSPAQQMIQRMLRTNGEQTSTAQVPTVLDRKQTTRTWFTGRGHLAGSTKRAKLVTAMFDTPYPYRLNYRDPSLASYIFEDEEQTRRWVEIHMVARHVLGEVKFGSDTTLYDVHPSPRPLRVLSTVMDIIRKEVQESKLAAIQFTGSDAGQNKLYGAIIRKFRQYPSFPYLGEHIVVLDKSRLQEVRDMLGE